eukprot:19964-Heterococcus_DN1.PRE.3
MHCCSKCMLPPDARQKLQYMHVVQGCCPQPLAQQISRELDLGAADVTIAPACATLSRSKNIYNSRKS